MSLTAKVAEMMSLRTPRRVDGEKLQAARERGSKAEALLRDESLQGAFKALDEAYQAIWRNTAPDEHEVRERAWASLKVLDDVRNQLLSVVRNGAVAHAELEKTLRR